MAQDSPDLGAVVEEDSKKNSRDYSTGGSDPDQIRVKMNFGVKEFSSDRDNCVQCSSDMEKVVVVDSGPVKGTRMNREAIPVCSDHVDDVVMAEQQDAENIEVLE